MTMQKSKQGGASLLGDARQAAQALRDLTEELSLLDSVTETCRRVITALDQLAVLPETAWNDSEAIAVLDEVVDSDAVSELEERFFFATERLEGDELGCFLAQLLEKIERRYVVLIESLHKLNATLDRF